MEIMSWLNGSFESFSYYSFELSAVYILYY